MVDSLDCLEAIANRDLKIVDSLDCLEACANKDLKMVEPWGGKIRNSHDILQILKATLQREWMGN